MFSFDWLFLFLRSSGGIVGDRAERGRTARGRFPYHSPPENMFVTVRNEYQQIADIESQTCVCFRRVAGFAVPGPVEAIILVGSLYFQDAHPGPLEIMLASNRSLNILDAVRKTAI